MSRSQRLHELLLAAKRRRAGIALLLALPWLLAGLLLAWRSGGGIAYAAPVALLILAAGVAWRAGRGVDGHWLARRLDALHRDFEDSAELLFADVSTLSPLARLQRSRLEQRLPSVSVSVPALRPPWPLRAFVANTLLAMIVAAAIMLWPSSATSPTTRKADDPAAVATASLATRITGQRIDIVPPAYTKMPPRSEASLQVRVPEGSTLLWTLRLSPQPARAELVFHDGTRLPLQRSGEDWMASRSLRKSTLYRLQVQGGPALANKGLWRIDVQPDRPPQIRVIEPDRSLALREEGQRQWPLSFEATDDHGLAGAELRITLAQGSGENISISERTLALRGDGDGRHRTYRHSLDLPASGFAEGDDLIVRLVVTDNRVPQAQATRSASFILRWPPPTGAEATGVEGMAKRVLPAYFRSQRQIIIDSEALLKQRGKMRNDDYESRSDGIGVDQRILRLRYGQFLGEEVSEVEKPPTKDGDEHSDGDGHDHGGKDESVATGDATSVVEAYGHSHDHAEAATLLDPETRALLKKALDQMWQAELHLRQGHPERALPYEYRALGFIKQVQQASRIYLARVGLALPPIDESRRLGGDRKGLQSRRDLLSAATTTTNAPDVLWRRLDPALPPITASELEAFDAWLRGHEAEVASALDLYAATDALRGEPGCVSCAGKLRALLWPLLARPATATQARERDDRAARAYLDALRQEPKP